jgi:hypothetical protein
MSLRTLLFLAAACLAAGCVLPAQYNTYKRSFPISGGQTIELDFAGGGVVAPENSDVKLERAVYKADAPPKTLVFEFGFLSKTGRVPRSVMVEDVSGPKAEILVEDDHPELRQGKHWYRMSGPKMNPDPRLDWLNEPDLTFRVFRFTIVTDDGRTIILYYAQGYSPEGKEFLRKRLAGDPSANP